MKTSHLDRLRAAATADDILQQLTLLTSESRKMKLNSQPLLNVIELRRWIPDNEPKFDLHNQETSIEQTPYIAAVDKNAGDGHYCYESFRIMRDCFDAGGYSVHFIPPRDLSVTTPPGLPYLKVSTQNADLNDIEHIPVYELNTLLESVKQILCPLTRSKYEDDLTRLRQQHPELDRSTNRSVSDDFLLAVSASIMKNYIEEIHKFWINCEKNKPRLTHPLTPIVYAWLCEQDSKPITAEYDKHRSVAILKREAMGSIRDVVFTRDEGGSVRSDFIASSAPKEKQLQLRGFDDPSSKLPNILPFELYQQGIATTKSAAVAMPVRLAFEALMQMEPGIYTERLHWQLGDLIDYLNPDGKFHWTNQVGYILTGLNSLYWLRFPYKHKGEGEVDWIPFLPRAVPNQNSTRDSTIIIEVSLPPDLNAHGMMVEKNVVRLMGKKSSARFNAYLTACWIYDHYGTVKGKIIYPTKPVERRNDHGYLLNHHDEPILTSHGKPVKDLYCPDALRQLDREENPSRDKYPILNNADLTRACYPKGVPKDQRREYLKRAKKAWAQLESDGYIRIEKFEHGWRIMPSAQHVQLYTALKSH